MINIDDIKGLAGTVKQLMGMAGVSRLSVGLQTIAHVEFADFVEAFGRTTASYSYGNEIRIDVDGVTFCAQKVRGVCVEKEGETV